MYQYIELSTPTDPIKFFENQFLATCKSTKYLQLSWQIANFTQSYGA